ncbi:MAG: serine/threonine protein kinase, partial [Candidatus Riflebacteria bacterium]|nr:serine/threonine protein kinase [Candidatus Riflebacteria bacterium]
MADTFAGYTLEAPLGKGGMGEVYRARRGESDPPVALKLLPPFTDGKLAERLLREGHPLSQLKHPNVVAVHEVGISHGQPFVAMELLDGESLSELIATRSEAGRPFEPGFARRVARGLAEALQAAHAAGVLHRDIKPSNVMLTTGGRVVLLDFGIALDTAANTRITQAGSTVGSLVYFSPEQSRNEPLDRRSDIYQYGLLLFEVLALSRPYGPCEPIVALTRRLKQGVPSVRTVRPDAEPDLAELVEWCLKPDRTARPAEFGAVLSRLGPEAPPDAAQAPCPAEPPVLAAVNRDGVPERLGAYRLLEKVGQGGMGMVYRARKGADPEDFAVKVVFPHRVSDRAVQSRFQREIRVARQLDHPNLVRFVDEGVDGQVAYYVMEFVRGTSLHGLLKERRPLALPEAVRIVTQVASALSAMHRAGLVHRDLKPGNVMLDEQGQVRLMDFGIAKSHDMTTLTQTDQLVGTPFYFPPEYSIDGEYDERGDLYQLGLIFHEIVTGRRDFPRYDHCTTMDQVLSSPSAGAPHELRQEPYRWLGPIYERLVAPDRATRYTSASDLLADLAAGPKKATRVPLDRTIPAGDAGVPAGPAPDRSPGSDQPAPARRAAPRPQPRLPTLVDTNRTPGGRRVGAAPAGAEL